MTPEIIGKVSAVHGFRIVVDLDAGARSPVRAGIHGAQTAVAINAYVSFEIGAGEVVIGTITDLDSRETFDPERGTDMTLDLVKPRRTASVQLLGTLRPRMESPNDAAGGKRPPFIFDPGITVLPTLDTVATTSPQPHLLAVFHEAPKCNRPDGYEGDDYDIGLDVGVPTGAPGQHLYGSFNDLFSRPLAIVGNTGSGKSYSVASLLSRSLRQTGSSGPQPHFFILDINGEYSRAFGIEKPYERRPDNIYLNGMNFSVPIWLMNSREISLWLDAAEKVQEPILKDNWSIWKSKNSSSIGQIGCKQNAVNYLDSALSSFADINYPGRKIKENWQTACAWIDYGGIAHSHDLRTDLNKMIGALTDFGVAPHSVRISPVLTNFKYSLDISSMQNYEDKGTLVLDFSDWLKQLFDFPLEPNDIKIIDCSMLSYEVLPYIVGIIGRILLELRQKQAMHQRFYQPWVVVLEEAHNYARPRREGEDTGLKVSREAFERIAKEGRKFGLSLIVASQRPSEVSPTILSQCANFLLHRLQNPQDIEHFRSIVPSQARRLLDQISILAAGEAIAFGSAFQVPTRVRIHKPAREPWSQTAAPWVEWSDPKAEPFDLETPLRNWGLKNAAPVEPSPPPAPPAKPPLPDLDDDIPF